eukprot:TRINITY_DN54307_c0_g1_i1.p1 TRINITY_DN54307_c0_g1~~TRINITY_DN54307_c0_g1_i1.p1  ORF type:complete len:249 (+),score=29.36 TRINITY_DN54307_c0_g1_i1:29-748(+)
MDPSLRAPQLQKLVALTLRTWKVDQMYRLACWAARVIAYWLEGKTPGSLAAKTLHALANQLSSARAVLRLTLPVMYVDALVNFKPSTEPILTKIDLTQNVAWLGYAVCDLLYFCCNAMPALFVEKLQMNGNKWGMWTSRFWVVGILLEAWADERKTKSSAQRRRLLQRELGSATGENARKQLAEMDKQWRQTQIKQIKQLCDLIMAWCWSVEQSPLSNSKVAMCAVVSSCVGIYQSWTA